MNIPYESFTILDHPFGAALQKIRKERRVPIRQFAQDCKLNIFRASKLDRGLTYPSPCEVEAIARGLELTDEERDELQALSELSTDDVPKHNLTEKEFVGHLPALMCRCDHEEDTEHKPPTEEQLDGIVAMILASMLY